MPRPAKSANSVLRRSRLNPDLRIMGLDASLSSTGYCFRDSSDLPCTGNIPTKNLRGSARLAYIRDIVDGLLMTFKPDLVVMEDYALHVQGRVFHIGELGGVLKTLIWDRGVDLMLVGPTQLKKVIGVRTRRNNGEKSAPGQHKKLEIRAAVLSQFGYDIDQNDQADAFCLMAIGEARRKGQGPSEFKVRALAADIGPVEKGQ